MNIGFITGIKHHAHSSYNALCIVKLKSKCNFLLEYIKYAKEDNLNDFISIVYDERIKNNSFFKGILINTQPILESELKREWNNVRKSLLQRLIIIYNTIYD